MDQSKSKVFLRALSSFFLFLGMGLCPVGLAAGDDDGEPFSSSSATLPPSENNSDANLTARLKQQAVIHYLEELGEDRINSHLGAITPEFAEKFVLQESAPMKSPGGKDVVLTGRLDGTEIRRWVRETLTKSVGGASLRPVYIFSSLVPGLTSFPRETAARTRESGVAGTLFTMLNQPFREFNSKLTPLSEPGFTMTQPPKRDSDIRSLRDLLSGAGYSSVLWVHLTPCTGCGTRIEYRFYQLTQGRQILSKTERLTLEGKDFGSADRIKGAFKEPTKEFTQEFKELVSSGVLFSNVYRFVVEGLLVKQFATFEANLARQEFVVRESVKRMDASQAEFEIYSPLNLTDLASRLRTLRAGGAEIRLEGTSQGDMPTIRAVVTSG